MKARRPRCRPTQRQERDLADRDVAGRPGARRHRAHDALGARRGADRHRRLRGQRCPTTAAARGRSRSPRTSSASARRSFTWIGGSNYTDDPDVRVAAHACGDGVGRLRRPVGRGAGHRRSSRRAPRRCPAYATGGRSSGSGRRTSRRSSRRFDTRRPRRGRRPPARYRFVVDGRRREGGDAVPYRVVSREFQVAPWGGITVDDVRSRGRRHACASGVGPRTTLDVNGRGGPDITAEIGPIDYPDSYASPARFITDERTFVRDPAAPGDPAPARVVLPRPARSGRGPTSATPPR